MKKLGHFYATTIVVLLCLMSEDVIAQGKGIKPAYVGIGLSKSHVNGSGLDAQDELGFYIQAGTVAEINSFSGVVGEIQFIKHTNKINMGDDKVKYTVQSLNLACYYKIYPIKKLFLTGGAQAGFLMRPRFDHQEVEIPTNGHIGVLGGAGYDFKRYSITVRGVRYLSDSKIFDSTIQIGLNYCFID
jgi:hypothetical protein